MINSSLAPEEIIKSFTEVNEKIALMNKYSTEDLLELSTKLKGYQQKIDEFVVDHDNENNRKKLKSFHLKISQITVDLQFNDIIRQKLEHLEELHATLIEELKAEDFEKLSKIIIGIAQLTKAQLGYIDTEYSSATNNVKDQLMLFWKDKVIAGTIELGILDILNNSDVFDKQVKMTSKILAKIIESGKEAVDFVESEYSGIQASYTMQSEREVFGQVFNIEIEEDDDDDIELF